MLIRAFRGLRVRPDLAATVAAPPYDVMNSAEARQMVAGKPHSFLHISRPEVDLDAGIESHDSACYAKAGENFQAWVNSGVMVRDASPCLYLYRLTYQGRSQLGIAAEVSVDAYMDGRVKRHEFTRPDKEDDRMRHIEATNSNSGPVFLVYRNRNDITTAVGAWTSTHRPVVDFVADDGVRHEVWVVDAPDAIAKLIVGIEAGGALYIADGHHRCAAAARVCQERRAQGKVDPEAAHNAFFGVMFPHDQVKIIDYNRVVRDLNGHPQAAFLAALGQAFSVESVEHQAKPERSGEVGMYLQGRWYKLKYNAGDLPRDPVARLDVSLLARHVLEPVLGIANPRTDKRIDFVGGIRGMDELQRLVDGGDYAVAFAMFPTSLEDLMAVADSGQVMPPKSTWFEPKLRDGLVCQVLDG